MLKSGCSQTVDLVNGSCTYVSSYASQKFYRRITHMHTYMVKRKHFRSMLYFLFVYPISLPDIHTFMIIQLLYPAFLTPTSEEFQTPTSEEFQSPPPSHQHTNYTNTHTHVYTHTHMYIHAHTHMYIHAHTHVHTRTHTHVHTRTHAQL